MISAPTPSSRDASTGTGTVFQRDTSSSSSCASGSLWTRVAKCALLCAMVCSSVCAFFFTWWAYVSVYLLEHKAFRSAIRITTSFWTSQRRSARSCRPLPRIGPRTFSQSGLDLHPVRSRAIDPSSFINVLIMLLVAPQTRSMYSSRATSRASTLWTLTHTPRGRMRYYSPTPSLPLFLPLPPRRLRPRHRYCV